MTTFSSKSVQRALKFIFVLPFFFAGQANADVLLPGTISTCGELAVSGKYTLTQNISNATSTCFIISSDGINLDGSGFTVSASGTVTLAISAKSYKSYPVTLLNGGNGYTNNVISNITFNGFTKIIDASGNPDTDGRGVNGGHGGNGGDIYLYYSKVSNISLVSQGGRTTTYGYGGVGGNISITDTDLNIGSSTIQNAGGIGITGTNVSGGVSLTYSGVFNHNGIVLSPLNYLTVNDIILITSYPGGTWPVLPGTISSCGTLLGPGTFILSSDIGTTTSPILGTCFTIASDGVTLDGAMYTLTSTSTNLAYAIEVGNYSNFVLASTTVSGFANLIHSTNQVTINGSYLNLSNQKITANSLVLNFKHSLNVLGTTLSNLVSLILNGVNKGAVSAGAFPGGSTIPALTITPPIFESPEYSVIWNPTISWSRADVCQYSYDNFTISHTVDCSKNGSDVLPPTSEGLFTIYLKSSDVEGNIANASTTFDYLFGIDTWIPRGISAVWSSVASSADGRKLVAIVYGGQIYTSTNSGITWNLSTSSPNKNWQSITSSADGSKLAAVVYGGQIYTSTDYGITWNVSVSSLNTSWTSIASSADGSKLAAIVYGGQIYTSTDSGSTWNVSASSANLYWQSITSSADGSKLAAIVSGGQIYTSTDSGSTWNVSASSANLYWQSITSSADGSKLIAVENYGGQIYLSQGTTTKFFVDILIPFSGEKLTSWSPYISWGSAVTCKYSYDSGATTTVSCANNGSDIPSLVSSGTHTLTVEGIDINNKIIEKNVTFDLTITKIVTPGVKILTPMKNSTVNSSSWNPIVNWDVNGIGIVSGCKYSYDNFVTTFMADCTKKGLDFLPPRFEGLVTLNISASDSDSTLNASTTFNYIKNYGPWVVGGVPLMWRSITSSADGSKLAAVPEGGQIYISSDSGVTWNASVSSPSKYWSSIASSADGSKLVATENYGGQIYTSINYGVTWTMSASSPKKNWKSVTSSSNGNKLAAVVDGGQIYTSTNSGVTWNVSASSPSKSWNSITSSSDGSKLVAVVDGGQIYTSTNSGVTWNVSASSPYQSWRSITSSSDGSKLAAVVDGGQIYTSTDSGVTWNVSASSPSQSWRSITSSADGSKLAAVVDGGQIYTSTDSGVTWNVSASSLSNAWYSIASSADGSKLAAVVFFGQIYTSTDSGVTWNVSASSLNNAWYSIASSADGSKLVAVLNGYQIYTSTDSGVTWNVSVSSPHQSWQSITSSSDGSKLAAIVEGGQIYTYQNFVPTISVDIVSPLSNTVISTWSPYISWGSAVTCKYSFDNGATTTTPCSNNGSDISRPVSSGIHTLVVEGIDINGVSVIKVSTFTYNFYIWCGTANTNWFNASNWYINADCATGHKANSYPKNSDNTVILQGSVAPIVSTSGLLPSIIDSTGLTGAAKISGLIFSSINNSVVITGNATFNGTSVNNGTVTGNATFNSRSRNAGTIGGNMIINSTYYNATVPTTHTFTVSGSAVWSGTVSGTIYASDGITAITDFNFTDSSRNTSVIMSTSTFSIGASNTNTVNSNATFTDSKSFSIGTVNGTVTLSGSNQTITGNSVVENFIKTPSGRDSLYLSSGSLLTVTGNTTLFGAGIDKLLSIFSTTPGSYASVLFNYISNMDFLRLKDVHNIGGVIDLSGKTVYDDGGNTGFIFKTNNQLGHAGSQGSTVGQYQLFTPPTKYAPPVVNSNPSGQTGQTSSRGSSSSISPSTGGGAARAFISGLLNTVSIPVNVPEKLTLKTLPVFGEDKGNFSLIEPIRSFVMAPMPKSIADIIKNSLNLSNLLASVGLVSEKDLVRASVNPIILKDSEASSTPGIFTVTASSTIVNTSLTTDLPEYKLVQLVHITLGMSLNVSFTPTGKDPVTATLGDKTIVFTKKTGKIVTADITIDTPGKYHLISPSAPFPLVIEVVVPPEYVIPVKAPVSMFSRMVGWFRHFF
jgi:hypothetical protein